jgi:hypothetical protein
LDCSSYNMYSFLVHVITCTKLQHVYHNNISLTWGLIITNFIFFINFCFSFCSFFFFLIQLMISWAVFIIPRNPGFEDDVVYHEQCSSPLKTGYCLQRNFSSTYQEFHCKNLSFYLFDTVNDKLNSFYNYLILVKHTCSQWILFSILTWW